MKNITEELKKTVTGDTLNLVKCWKITLKNGDILAFTNASENFEYGELEYNHITAKDVDGIKSNPDIKEDTLKVSNIISSELIDANDILSGKYDSAKVEVFLVDLQNLNQGRVVLLNGKINNIEYKNDTFTAEVHGLKNEIDRTIGNVYSPLCRAEFCSKKCGLNKSNYTFSGGISTLIDEISFKTDSLIISNKPKGYFENGVIEFTSGKNIGQKIEVKQFSSGVFMLAMELPYKLEVGDTFNAIAGCDRYFTTCCKKFNNAVNFRGEPHLPGIELLLKVM